MMPFQREAVENALNGTLCECSCGSLFFHNAFKFCASAKFEYVFVCAKCRNVWIHVDKDTGLLPRRRFGWDLAEKIVKSTQCCTIIGPKTQPTMTVLDMMLV